MISAPTWLPRRLLLAIDIMLDVAFHEAGGPVPAAALAARLGMETRKLEAVLQNLGRRKLLKSLRGPNGGYLLAAERSTITMRMIAEAFRDGELEGDAEPEERSATLRKVVLPQAVRWQTSLLEEMEKTSLADLCRYARQAGFESQFDGIVDFVI